MPTVCSQLIILLDNLLPPLFWAVASKYSFKVNIRWEFCHTLFMVVIHGIRHMQIIWRYHKNFGESRHREGLEGGGGGDNDSHVIRNVVRVIASDNHELVGTVTLSLSATNIPRVTNKHKNMSSVIFQGDTNVSEIHTASIFRAYVEATCSSETLVSTHQSTRRYNPEQHRHLHHRENLVSRTVVISFTLLLLETCLVVFPPILLIRLTCTWTWRSPQRSVVTIYFWNKENKLLNFIINVRVIIYIYIYITRVVQKNFHTSLLYNRIVAQQWKSLIPTGAGHPGCLLRRKSATDRYGRAHKVFFAHARSWRTHNIG
jgi:hypothetical protein